MKKVVVIVGPTAVGKSDFAVSIAREMNGEILSGDSIQVYRGLDIGSGKVTKEEMDGIPHYLIDILDPKDKYSVAEFQRLARECIDDITSRGKMPIIAGGTGLYIKACLYDYEFSSNEVKLDSKYDELTNEELYSVLKEIDEGACATIHMNNRKRVMRALAIALSGKTKSELEASQEHKPIYDVCIVGLTCERELLYNRINQRVEKMMQYGLKAEIQSLLNEGVDFTDLSMQGIGYREWQGYFKDKLSEEDVKANIQTHSRQFAKRQYTWFNNQMKVTWLDITNPDFVEEGMKLINQWRKENE